MQKKKFLKEIKNANPVNTQNNKNTKQPYYWYGESFLVVQIEDQISHVIFSKNLIQNKALNLFKSSISRTFSSFPDETMYPLNTESPSPSFLQVLATAILSPVSMNLTTLGTSSNRIIQHWSFSDCNIKFSTMNIKFIHIVCVKIPFLFKVK